MTEILNRSMMDMAYKSVRRKNTLPFGKYWIVGGAMVGVAIVSVLLTLVVLQQSDSNTPEQVVVVPSREKTEALDEVVLPEDVSLDDSIVMNKQYKEQATPTPQFTFYESLPEMEVVIPEAGSRKYIRQSPAPASVEIAKIASTAVAGNYYLQAGSFRDKELADKLKFELAWLGFKTNIQDISVKDLEVYHRVRIGPFTDLEAIEKTKQRLSELGVETSTVKEK